MNLELGVARGYEGETKEIKMTPEVLEEFIKHNRIPVNSENLRDRCVDGRYSFADINECPVIAKPGATGGDVMAAFAALNILGKQLTNQAVLDSVINAEGGCDKFCFHTDDHAEHDHAGAGMGCGHMKKAKLEPDSYGVRQEQIDFLFAKLPELLKQSARQEVLHGEHVESAVVVVESEQFGLRPNWQTENGLQEVFVYQKTFHQKQLDELAKRLQEALAAAGEAVEEQDIRKALDEAFALQLGATVKRLADGLPIYTVRISEDEIQIQ